METPICDFVKAYTEKQALRMHMPGHKGKAFLGMEAMDITEIDGADVLYAPEGIIRQSEANAAALFGTARTVYSAEGSSLCIRAMLYLAMLYGGREGKRPLIAAGRNAHKTFMTAAALLDLDVCWLYPETEENVLSCTFSGEWLEKCLTEMQEKPVCVYITSPDYLGHTADVADIAKTCHRHNILLLVDNAHGAYLQFLPESQHPIALGADMCCDSAHKTLPALTGGAYLHIAQCAPALFCGQAERAMALFASTSPSYLILQSLDMVNRYLSDNYRERLADLIVGVDRLKEQLRRQGFALIGSEPVKLTIAPKSYGYTGIALAQILQQHNIVCEFADLDYLVMMCTPETGTAGLERLALVLAGIEKRAPITELPPLPTKTQQVLSIREALFSPSHTMPVDACVGKVMASAAVNCPPAIPIVVCGERIDAHAAACLRYYGTVFCDVVDDV